MAQMSVKIEGLDKVRSMLNILRTEDIPKAMMYIQNNTAYKMMVREKQEINKVIDRPTARTKASPHYVKTTVTGQPPAEVNITPRAPSGTPPVKYMYHHVHGGVRDVKGFEYALRDMGLLPAGMVTAPGYDATINSYGNQSPAELRKIVNGLRAMQGIAIPAGGRALKRGQWMVVSGGRGGMGGVFYLAGGQVKNMLNFIRPVNYRERFDFYTVGIQEASRIFRAEADAVIMRQLGKYAG